MPSVSVIMNIRNGAAFLREAIDSVLAQTFLDWEIIAWDDCSSDDSAAIIGEYKDHRIKYFLAPKNTTLGKARNDAIRRASGEWLAFLDQDDVWVPYKLERQIVLANPQIGIIYGRTLLIYSNGKRQDYDYAHEFTLLPEGNIFTHLFSDACFIAMSSAVLRRTAVDEIGGIPESITVVPDYYLYTAIAHGYYARAVQEVVSFYRMHAGNMSRSRDSRLYSEPLDIVNRWAPLLPPEVVAYRRKTYSSVIALDELRNPATILAGLRRLLSQGSVAWLCQRPFVHLRRALRRHVQRPYWRRISSHPA